jgi:Flp pilus assembly protein TadD
MIPRQPDKPIHRTVWICLGLVLVTFLVYARVLNCGFIDYDDPDYVTANPHVQNGLTVQGIVWAFSHVHSSNWHPMTWISHMLDCQLWGLNPRGPHLVNVGFHALNAVLLFLLLQRLTSATWRSALVAGLFAWHPLHVESVAWVAERKDVLSTFFGLLSLLFYVRYAQNKSPLNLQHSTLNYILALVLFALGLMSKPMLVTLPLVLLLLDWWPLQRVSSFKFSVSSSGGTPLAGGDRQVLSFRQLVLEKLPFFGLAAASAVVTFFVQKSSGAVSSLAQAPLPVRLENAAASYVAYLAKMFWPANLALIYPYRPDVGTGKVVLAVLLLAGVTVLVLVLARQFRFLAMGWGWYLVTLLPVIGLVQVGSQAMADRYTYVPLIGVFIALVWGVALLVERRRQMQIPATIVAIGILAACAAVTDRQLRYWTDTRTLCEHTLRVTSDNAVAHFILANVLMEQGDVATAVEHYREAIRLKSDYPDARLNLTVALQRLGKPDEAMNGLQNLLQADPSLAKAHDKLAILLWQQGQIASAIAQFQEALRLDPDSTEAANNLAWLRATCPDPAYRNGPEAVRLAERAVQLSGKMADAGLLDTLAAALAEAGRFDEAVQMAGQARELALAEQKSQLAERVAKRQELYRQHQAYRSGPD